VKGDNCMSRIIAIANQKGGVAKTTSVHNLACALANQNKKVLMVDLDSQASLTISSGIEPLNIEHNIVSILSKGSKNIIDCIQSLKENLHIVSSVIDLAQIEMDMFSRPSREKILDRALEPIKNEYDYILIDCPPQLSILTINALSCCDAVIIPTKTDYLAYRGISQLYDTIEEIKDLINPKLKVLGVIATMYEMKISDDVAILNLLRKNYNVIGIVKKMAQIKKGILDGQSVVDKFQTSEGAQEYMKISKVVLNYNY